MNNQRWWGLVSISITLAIALSRPAVAQYAVEVVSYDQGTTVATEFGTDLPFNISSAAIGLPSRFSNDPFFPSVVSPFSPAYLRDQIVSIGEGGHLTLRLSNYAIPQAGPPEIGVFSNVGLRDKHYPDGLAQMPAKTFGFDSALVEVSADGVSWTSLGSTDFDLPTNGYADSTSPYSGMAGNVPADFQQPFTHALGEFSGLNYYQLGGPDILGLLAGSGGGKWLDISGFGLSQVGFIRFSVADDLDANTMLNFEVDGVSVSHAALGAPTVPEPATLVLVTQLLLGLGFVGRRLRLP